jgi:hypothetical protein
MNFLNRLFYVNRAILAVLAIAVWPVWPAGFLAWIHLHRELILGILIGSVAELLIVYASRWTWDRVQWMRWFSHQ